MPITRDVNDLHRMRILDVFPLYNKVAITFKIEGTNRDTNFQDFTLFVSTSEDMVNIIKNFSIPTSESFNSQTRNQNIRTIVVDGLTPATPTDLYLKFENKSTQVTHVSFTTLSAPFQIPNLCVHELEEVGEEYEYGSLYSIKLKWDLNDHIWRRLSRFLFLENMKFIIRFDDIYNGTNWTCDLIHRGLICTGRISKQNKLSYQISSIDTTNFTPSTSSITVSNPEWRNTIKDIYRSDNAYSSESRVILMDNRKKTLMYTGLTKVGPEGENMLRDFCNNFPLKKNFISDAFMNGVTYISTDIGGFYTTDSGMTWTLDARVFGIPIKKVIVLKAIKCVIYELNTTHGDNVIVDIVYDGNRRGFFTSNYTGEEAIGNILDMQVIPGYPQSTPHIQIVSDHYGFGSPTHFHVLKYNSGIYGFEKVYSIDLSKIPVDSTYRSYGNDSYDRNLVNLKEVKLVQKMFAIDQKYDTDESFTTHDIMVSLGDNNIHSLTFDSNQMNVTGNTFVSDGSSPQYIYQLDHRRMNIERQTGMVDSFIASSIDTILKLRLDKGSSSGGGGYES